MKVDKERCLKAMKNIFIEGVPEDGMREDKIEEAIRLIQESPSEALAERYLGVKNYASFGDQGSDCEYGGSPRHGSIVFRIGRVTTTGERSELGADEIYLLECARDFGYVKMDKDPSKPWQSDRVKCNLCDVFKRLDYSNNKVQEAMAILDKDIAVEEEPKGDCAGVRFKMDGNKWCATRPNFVNIQVSHAGFGNTTEEAEADLIDNEGKEAR